jgi:ribosomal protein S18 acetylase RimI-like enzyme
MSDEPHGAQLPSEWKTERLMMRDAIEKDLSELRKIHEECSYIDELIGHRDEAADPMLSEFRGECLPPNGKKELHRLQTITESSSKEMVGYLITYHGFPDPDIFWIAQLSIRPQHQRQKFGQEVIAGLSTEVKKLEKYTKLGIGIGVGNEPAMKFWTTCGFTGILKTLNRGTHAEEWRVKRL